MSNEPTLAELKAATLEEWKGLQSDIQVKKKAEIDGKIASIILLSAETGQEFKEEDFKDSNVASLTILEKQLKYFLEAKNAGETGEPASGIVPRGGEPPKTLSKKELNNKVIDMITHSFGLPRPDSDKPKAGEMSGAEYEELCEEVRMEHYGQGLRY
jgi:hypothetical protein